MSAPEKFLAEVGVVFDNAVVDHSQFSRPVAMRVSVGVAGQTVGSPTGMADAQRTGHGLLFQELCQALDSAHAFAHLQRAGIQSAKTRRVVAAIFQPAQALQQQRSCALVANVPYNAAHDLRNPNPESRKKPECRNPKTETNPGYDIRNPKPIQMLIPFNLFNPFNSPERVPSQLPPTNRPR